MESNLAGGWTPYSTKISSDAQKAFDEAFKGFAGVHYTPLVVASQVVKGINYRFFCNAQIIYPNAPHHGALVQIYKPLSGPAILSAPIKPVD
ncbi:MAG: hypothetical protein PHS59_09885 [Paludibacter sp.]|nr:hypothetical protein [Paludibacter sp.]